MKFAIFRRCPVTVTTLTLTLPRGGVRRRNIREVDHGQGKRNPDTGREPGAETGGGDQDHDRRRGGTEIETGTEGGFDVVVLVLSLDAEGNGEGGGAEVGSFPWVLS